MRCSSLLHRRDGHQNHHQCHLKLQFLLGNRFSFGKWGMVEKQCKTKGLVGVIYKLVKKREREREREWTLGVRKKQSTWPRCIVMIDKWWYTSMWWYTRGMSLFWLLVTMHCDDILACVTHMHCDKPFTHMSYMYKP